MKAGTRWLLIAGVVALAGSGIYLSQRSEAGPVPVDEALRIDVKRRDLVIEVVDTGKIQPKEKIEIKSKVAGQVQQVRTAQNRAELSTTAARASTADAPAGTAPSGRCRDLTS